MTEKPSLIVLTPVRNEAWVLDAFLAATSLWADRIILADQMSTDGSREIAQKYPKVTLVDNQSATMHQANARMLLFKEADKIEGEKVLFCLDADEFLSGDFMQTDTWKSMLTVGDRCVAYCLKWVNVWGDLNHRIADESSHAEWIGYFPKGRMVADLYASREKNAVHESRLPCLPESEMDYVIVDDIRLIHLARYNPNRQEAKKMFYMVSTVRDRNAVSAVSINRLYRLHANESPATGEVADEMYAYYTNHSVCLEKMVLRSDGLFVDYVVDIIAKEGPGKYVSLDIWWWPELNKRFGDPRPLRWKMLHRYLRKSDAHRSSIVVRAIDKILKKIC